MLLLLGGSRECDVARPSPVMNLKKALDAYVARSSTGVSNEWVAERLAMGHPLNVSRAVRRVSESRVLRKKAEALAELGIRKARESSPVHRNAK